MRDVKSVKENGPHVYVGGWEHINIYIHTRTILRRAMKILLFYLTGVKKKRKTLQVRFSRDK